MPLICFLLSTKHQTVQKNANYNSKNCQLVLYDIHLFVPGNEQFKPRLHSPFYKSHVRAR